MHPQDLQSALVNYTVANSGHKPQRAYIGMSQIGGCPRAIARAATAGQPATQNDHLRFYVGYLFEHDIQARLEALGLWKPESRIEIVAAFDKRYQGHADGVVDGALLEIKSITQEKLDHILASGRIPNEHFSQVQAYMTHSAYKVAQIVYVARETGAIWVEQLKWHPRVGDRLDAKARMILQHIDMGRVPPCECTRCRRVN